MATHLVRGGGIFGARATVTMPSACGRRRSAVALRISGNVGVAFSTAAAGADVAAVPWPSVT